MRLATVGSRRIAVLCLAALLAAAACSSATTPSPAAASTPSASSASSPAPSASGAASASPAASGSVAGASAGSPGTVTIQNFAFNPATITVKAGTSVTWTNNDSTDHTVSEDKGAFDSGHVSPGKTFSQTFQTAGTFAYHCKIHPSMTATVVVQ